MLDILASTKNKTAAEVAVEIVTEAPRISGQTVLYAALAATTAGRAKVIVREDATKHGAWACARMRERFGRDSEEASFTQVFQCSWPSENAVRRRVALVGQEGLEAFTRVTELTSD